MRGIVLLRAHLRLSAGSFSAPDPARSRLVPSKSRAQPVGGILGVCTWRGVAALPPGPCQRVEPAEVFPRYRGIPVLLTPVVAAGSSRRSNRGTAV